MQYQFKKNYTYEAMNIYKGTPNVVFYELHLSQQRIQKRVFSPSHSSV